MKKRNIIFYRNAYYNFYYLSKALRKRGWDAITVSIEDPESDVYKLYHGEDVNLYSPDPEVFQKNLEDFFEEALLRFDMVYFQGDHCLSFFPKYYNELIAPDILEWKKAGKRIGYISSGCLSGIAKSTIGQWSSLDSNKVCCDRCSYDSSICSDKRNLRWGRQYSSICDIVSAVYLPALDYMASDNIYYDPLDVAIHKDIWRPDLEIPEEHLIKNDENEVLIYHAMANYDSRTKGVQNIKGTSAIVDAVDRLRDEGIKCRLIFATGIPNIEVRFIQVQADIVVEQLNMGRCGATSREGLMLGKPVITYLNRNEPVLNNEHESMKDIPFVSAGEENIYEVLKELVLDESKRKELGAESRNYALKWFDADAMAERFEKVYDEVIENGRFNNGMNDRYPDAMRYKQKDIIDHYIELAERGEYTADSKIDPPTSSKLFQEKWVEYLEKAWVYRKVPHYINERLKTPICEFGKNFEDALVALEFGDDAAAHNSFQLSLPHFESRSIPFREIKIDDYLYLSAQCALRIRELKSAAEYLTKAIQVNSEFTQALEQLSELLFMGEHYAKSKQTMELAYLSDPTKKSLLPKLAEINAKLGLAENDFTQNDKWLHERIVLSEQYIESGEHDKARNILDALLALFPDSVDALNNLAVLEALNGNTESALANIHRVLQIDPQNEQALENRKVLAG